MPGRGHVKITADTGQAAKSMNVLQGSFTEMKSKIDLAGQGFRALTGIMGGVNEVIKKQGVWFSQIGKMGKGAIGIVQHMMDATDGLIDSSEIMKNYNILLRGGLDLTMEQFEALSKGAVEMARATGKSTESVMSAFTNAITSGRVSAVNKFGLALDETGSVAEKQTRIIDALTKKYGGLTIAVGDAAEAVDSVRNKQKVQTMIAAKALDDLSQRWTTFKGNLVESSSQIIEYLTFKDGISQLSQYRLATEELAELQIKAGVELQKQAMRAAGWRARNLELTYEIGMSEADNLKLNEKRARNLAMAERVQKKALVAAKERVKFATLLSKRHGLTAEQAQRYAFLIQTAKEELQAQEKSLATIQTRLTAVRKDAKEYMDAMRGAAEALSQKLTSGTMGVLIGLFTGDTVVTRSKSVKKTLSDVQKKAIEIRQAWSHVFTTQDAQAFFKLYGAATKEGAINLMKARAQMSEGQKKLYEEGNALREKTEAERAAMHQKRKARMIDIEAKARAQSDYLESEKTKREELLMKMERAGLLEKQRLEIQKMQAEVRAAISRGDFIGARAGQLQIEQMQQRLALLQQTIGLTKQTTEAVISAALTESSVLKQQGKTRAQAIGEALKALGKQYLVKSLGSLAEGTAALFFNPAGAAALFKASGIYAAAALMAGASGTALASSGGGGSAQATPQSAPTASTSGVGGTSQTTVYSLTLSNSLIAENNDELYRQFKRIGADAESRGVA